MLAQANPLPVRIYDALAQFPEGLVGAEIRELFPDEENPNAVYSTLNVLKMTGNVKVIGKRISPASGRAASVYGVTGVPYTPGRVVSRKSPTSAGLQARLNEALSRLQELEAWKVAAVARFPELGVDPLMIEARKRVASILSAGGDVSGAEQVRAGNRDATAIVKAVFTTLQDLAA